MLEEQQKKFMEKIKNMFNKDKMKNGNNKKKIENLVTLVVILIITVVAINSIWNDDKKNSKENTESKQKILAKKDETDIESIEDEENLETRLENILESMDGVGKVKVLLTYSESSKTVAMYNEDLNKSDTEETDSGGGNRKVTQTSNKKEVIYKEVNGEKIPVTQNIINPKIEGAIITAKGAASSYVKTNIVQAVEAATGLATHKIQVFEMQE